MDFTAARVFVFPSALFVDLPFARFLPIPWLGAFSPSIAQEAQSFFFPCWFQPFSLEFEDKRFFASTRLILKKRSPFSPRRLRQPLFRDHPKLSVTFCLGCLAKATLI